MSRELRKVTRTVFAPGTYSSRRWRRTEAGADVFLPAPEGPFNVLRFKIEDASGELLVTVHFGGQAFVDAPEVTS